MDFKTLAAIIYAEYCEAVGGKAFNGDPLPDWQSFRSDQSKKRQADAWECAALAALGAMESK